MCGYQNCCSVRISLTFVFILRLRRLLKKENKERRRKERMGWDNEYLHYTNTDNPFGDANLLSTFVWTKKLSKEGLIGVSREEIETRNRHKQEENKKELEKVRKQNPGRCTFYYVHVTRSNFRLKREDSNANWNDSRGTRRCSYCRGAKKRPNLRNGNGKRTNFIWNKPA